MTGTITLTTQACLYCGQTHEVTMPLEAYDRWHNKREHLQRAWPEADAATRELLISGVDGECWEKYLSDDE